MRDAASTTQPSARTLEDVRLRGGVLELHASDGVYLVTPYAETILQTAFVPHGAVFEPASHALVLSPGTVRTELREFDDRIEFATAGIALTVWRAPLRLAYSYRGEALLAEERGPVPKDGDDPAHDRLEFRIAPDEALYGGGARALGMNRRGHRLALYNQAHYGYEERSELMSYCMPLVLSSKRYLLHFDNPATGYLDLDRDGHGLLTYGTSGGRLVYQVVAGARWENLVGEYTRLTGRQPLPPRWAFGNFASRFGYRSEAEARATVAHYRAAAIPLDAIVFDLYWFGPEMRFTSMGNLAWDRTAFPTPEAMIADFAAQGVRTVLITEPFVLTASTRWAEARARGALVEDGAGAPLTFDFFFGESGLIDIVKPQARAWFWDIYKTLAAQGVAGWWGDLGEPEAHPAHAVHATGTGSASAAQVHNIYGHEWARLLRDGYRRDFPRRRPFILMRAGYSGSQRFGLIPWSGDVERSWGGLRSQVEIALQMGMQGLAYMHSDLGGFANPNLDDELYVRWLQYGVFQPVFRPHGQDSVPSEPVYRSPGAMALARQAILLRYRLLPYIYTMAFENSRSGMPLMRPLFFEQPDDPALAAECGAYLWGDAFLVAPVTEPGQRSIAMDFPASAAWFDFHGGRRHAPGSRATLALAPDRIPVFVRAGAFLPLAGGHDPTRLELHYYHDRSVRAAQAKLYEDDGATPDAFERGAYILTRFASRTRGALLALSIASQAGALQRARARRIEVVVHNLRRRPERVLADGAMLAFTWQRASRCLRFSVDQRGRRVALRIVLPGGAVKARARAG